MELDWLKRWNTYSPAAVAIKDGDTGREISYRDLYEVSCAAAALLQRDYGIRTGDRVAVFSTNELEYVFLFFALQRLGAILVPVNFRLTPREVEHILTDCAPKLLVYQNDLLPVVEALPATAKPRLLPLQGPNSFAAFARQEQARHEDFHGQAADPVMIIYTSGTTGSPKGAVLTHEMLFWNSVNTTLRLNISQSDCTVIFLPFFHTGGWNVLTTPFLHRGAKVVFLKKFDSDRILQLSQDEKATLLFGVPTTMDMMTLSPLFDQVDLSSIRYAIVGGEPMPIELIRTWHEKGIPIRQGYGLTEFGPNVFSLNEGDALRKIGSIGFPNFYVSAKIVDDHGRECGANEIGELVLKGPMCMQGYWNNAAATHETVRDGWLHTGDLVRRDEEGFYYVVGRKKDMYKSGGENVYPAELEKVMRSLPGIREVAVIGVADEKWGEVGQAFVVKDSHHITEETLREHCLKNLAKFKVPKFFVFMDSLPKGESGKILKKALRVPLAQ
ncbi:MAG: long-chain fatty acid--CoA ligase [Bdellovibrionaceae bacterium]|nr:long-chain fatty acid--CoA ligase [Pseudobdellovibrionaceae bacterium]MBX3034544.1 long-chain fatty acid--CoA ligase [Pseudobdellovibrionaceae bacterium]